LNTEAVANAAFLLKHKILLAEDNIAEIAAEDPNESPNLKKEKQVAKRHLRKLRKKAEARQQSCEVAASSHEAASSHDAKATG